MAPDKCADRVRSILFKAVRDTQRIDPFIDDVWISYCKDWNPEGLASDKCVSLDPRRYSNSFLSDFLRHVSAVVQSDEPRIAFTQKTSVKSRPPPICSTMLLRQHAGREVRHLVICVGQGELTPSDRSDTVYGSVSVALPSQYVTHSGAAVAMLMQSLGSGLFEQTVGTRLAADLKLSCFHFEGKFTSLPARGEPVYVNRIDNINNVLRAFGVDAGASKSHMGIATPEGVLDPRLEHFVAAGCGHGVQVPYFHIEPKAMIRYMTVRRTKVLVDQLLLQQICDSSSVDNGVSTWWDRGGLAIVSRLLAFYGLDKTDTLVVHLHPNGLLLSSKKQCRTNPRDILIA